LLLSALLITEPVSRPVFTRSSS